MEVLGNCSFKIPGQSNSVKMVATVKINIDANRMGRQKRWKFIMMGAKWQMREANKNASEV